MFDTFTKIPHTLEEAAGTMSTMGEIADRLYTIIPQPKYSVMWHTNYVTLSIAKVITMLTVIETEDIYEMRSEYYENRNYGFKDSTEREYDNKFGIVINQEASTHFEPTDYPNAQYLTNAQDFLKQSSHHFIKIFTTPVNNFLYVWTNKELTPDSLYKLFSLEAKIHNRTNLIVNAFLKAFIEDSVEDAKKILTDFFNSDKIVDLEYSNFKKCMVNQNETKIRSLETRINNARADINDYEERITSLASEMRTWTENIAFLRSIKDDDESRLFFKHLKKIPYIVNFTASSEGFIDLYYEAPLIYFADYPAEKILAQDYRGESAKRIIKIILGRKYQLYTKCVLQFDTSSFSVNNKSRRTPTTILPHPHIARYGCFGNHRRAIAESAEAGDYIGAIEQITQAVLNLNFYDSCVIDSMIHALIDKWHTLPTWKCVETGEMLTTEQVIERNDYYEETQTDNTGEN